MFRISKVSLNKKQRYAMLNKKNILAGFFLKKYDSSPFMTRQRASVFMWIQIVFIFLILLTQASTNILTPEVATKFYNLSMFFILSGFIVCLFILKSGSYNTAAYSGIILPLILVVAQGLQVSTMSGKYIYLLYLLIFIVMASLFGRRSTIIVITMFVIASTIIIVIKSGQIIPPDKHISTISNMVIVTIFIAVLCMLIFKIVNATLDEAQSKNSELTKSLAENNRILQTCATVAVTLKNTSEDLSINAATFSKNAQIQASGVEEISSTMEEMLSSVNQNADNSSEAESISEKSYRLAGEGTEIVNNAVVAINEINESSKKISEIIILINDIAFQTNLLALNASIEAARAGDSGRGFAVVASEVRNLAQRSREASDEISKLIKNSVEKVEIGTTQVNRSGESLKEIFSSIEQTRKIIEEINLLSREQKEGLGQVTTALNQADTMSQQTASAAEELHSSAEQLKQTSAELQELMTVFKA